MVKYIKGITMWKHLCNAFCKKVHRNPSKAMESAPPKWPTAARSVYESSVTAAQPKDSCSYCSWK